MCGTFLVSYTVLAFAVLLGIALAFVHYFSDRIHLAHRKRRMKILSFTAGIFLVYLFLDLLPTMHLGDITLTRFSLIFIVIGFSTLHFAENFVYKRKYKNAEMLKRELREIHSLSFFIYHFFILLSNQVSKIKIPNNQSTYSNLIQSQKLLRAMIFHLLIMVKCPQILCKPLKTL